MKVKVLLLIVLLTPIAFGLSNDPAGRVSHGKKFVHPGIFYTEKDFARMRKLVGEKREPWYRCFIALRDSKWAHGFARGRGGDIPTGKFNQTIGFDGRCAHDIALMWKITGEEDYAIRARDILNSNSHWVSTSWGGTGPLDNGKIYLLIEAAEMMRDYPGWAKEDQDRFKKMLRDVFYPHIMSGDIMRWGNQGLTAWHGVLAMAIYLDDVKMYDRVWNNINGRKHRPDDVPYVSGGAWSPDWPADYGEFCISRRNHPVLGNEPDWGYGDQLRFYIYKNGQCEESSRDQSHAMYGLMQMVSIAEIFSNQGDDLYGQLDNRILTGLEWGLRYNQSAWEPTGYTDKEDEVSFENGKYLQVRTRNNRWTSLKPSPWGRGSDGGPAAPKTAALMHYAVKKKLSDKKLEYLRRAVGAQLKNGGYESWGFGANWYYEFEGWGTLTKLLPEYLEMRQKHKAKLKGKTR